MVKNTAVEQSKPLFFLELSNKMMPLWTQFVEVSQEVKKHFGIVWKPSLYLLTIYTSDIHYCILLTLELLAVINM